MRLAALALLLFSGCATARPCEVMDKETGRSVDIGMDCVCSGTPIQSMTCRRTE